MRRPTLIGLAAALSLVLCLPHLARADEKPAPAGKPASKPAAKQAGDNVYMWKATGKTGVPVYLVGSIHVGKEDFYPLPDPIQKAFAESKTLVVEVDIENLDQNKLAQSMMQKGAFPPGQDLEGNVSKETFAAWREYSQKKGLPGPMMERLRPWVLGLVVTLNEMQEIGFSPELGVDKHFLQRARKDKKAIEELESADSQLDLLSGMDEKTQDLFLRYSLQDVKTLKEQMTRMADLWKAGDADGMANTVLEDKLDEQPEMKPLMKVMLDDRNEKMAEKIEKYLKDGKAPTFVVVGAAHLAGEKSIQAMLKEKGYEVTQVERGEKK